MKNRKTDKDRITEQVSQLLRLQQRSHSLLLLAGLASRREESRYEDLPEGRVPLERVAIELLDPTRGEGLPVPVVKGEFLIEQADEDRSQRLVATLAERNLEPGARERGECAGVLRLVPSRHDEQPDLRAALADAEEAGVRASVNHVVALSPRMKGGSSPEYTDAPLRPFDEYSVEADDGGLVVVIDTGLDERERGDGWLRDVAPVDAARDFDPLDVVHASGAPGADGYLDRGAGHGTFVAGIVRRVDPNADVRLIRALDTDGVGSECSVAAAVLQAAEIFAQHGNRGVLNLSLGMETVDGLAPLALEAALEALPPDVLVVASAGNSGTSTPTWPAASKRVLGVAGLTPDPDGNRLLPAEWSNRGYWVDFSTLAEGVISTYVEGTETKGTGLPGDPFDRDPETFPRKDPRQQESYAIWTGTSFAAPQVAAWLGKYLAEHPGEPSHDAVRALRSRGSRINGFGYAVQIPMIA